MKIQIKQRDNGAVLFECKAPEGMERGLAMRHALEQAVQSRANLSGANLSGADLNGADLSYAKGAELAIAKTRILPEGSLIGWKKCMHGVIVKLRIPEEAKRCHAFGRKCRAEYVEVLEVIGADFGVSQHDQKTKYIRGGIIRPDFFDENWQDECSNGIHFFISELEARDY